MSPKPPDSLTNEQCWAIAKKVWPKLSDEDPLMTRARYTSMVADIAWHGHRDDRLKDAEEAKITEILRG